MGQSAVRLLSGDRLALSSTAILRRPDRYAIYLNQSGLGLPDRDYYLKPDFAEQREAYTAYAAKLLSLIGWADPDATAAQVIAL